MNGNVLSPKFALIAVELFASACSLALPAHSEKPRLQYPPLALFWLSGDVFSAGIEVHQIDQIPVRIYGREKTVADCLKFRNKIGLGVAREALREAVRQGCRVEVLLQYARIDQKEG